MNVCGIAIGKRRVEFTLIQHKLGEDGKKTYTLLKQQTVFVPKGFLNNPFSIGYRIKGLNILDSTDFCRILYGNDPKTSEETQRQKQIVYAFIKEHIESLGLQMYTESNRTFQYRLGKRSFLSHKHILAWVLTKIEGVHRTMLIDRNKVSTHKTLSMICACDMWGYKEKHHGNRISDKANAS